eukprot:TRINITY_DN1945_c0_g1_i4.p1 TRINITY_DN1945_c0_g1~~TRINITY_DN1945_c0_g1_i4.p1  ORF type:complete len:122 (+),score=6.27 TRINITY_DN1945_c0_g1_i4:137-502(+)
MQWATRHGIHKPLSSLEGHDLGLTDSEIQSGLVDYNEGVLLVMSPYEDLSNTESRLFVRANKMSDKGIDIPYACGLSMEDVFPPYRCGYKPSIPDEIQFIGSLASYMSTCHAEDDWWVGTY